MIPRNRWITIGNQKYPLSAKLTPSKATNMKYKEHLKANISPEYGAAAYLNYSELDGIIRDLAEQAPSM